MERQLARSNKACWRYRSSVVAFNQRQIVIASQVMIFVVVFVVVLMMVVVDGFVLSVTSNGE